MADGGYKLDRPLGKGLRLGKAEARHYGKRGGLAHRALNQYVIEGESLCAVDIAARLGVSKSTVNKRLKDARESEGPLTWAKLGA